MVANNVNNQLRILILKNKFVQVPKSLLILMGEETIIFWMKQKLLIPINKIKKILNFIVKV